jgi:hypothetical protein
MPQSIFLTLLLGSILWSVGPKYSSAADARWASVSGKVSVAGNYHPQKPLPVFKNRAFCGPAVPNETFLVGSDGGLRNAVVLLHPIGMKIVPKPGAIILDNKQCAFVPHVQVATVGSELLMKNSDPILHTVHARLGRETLFNVGLPRWREVTKPLNRAGIIRIDCDVLHTWMSAVIIVADTPYFAVTDEKGRFMIDQLPAGRYQVEIWHEKLGVKSNEIALHGDKPLSLDVFYALNGKF